ncbi:MAG TPA: periplasmic heavy metal sensor [Thermoanaerobaculia bacterium]|nr:periplasmic heavy metal sensor [Thermoanaerobaculia bacterium]
MNKKHLTIAGVIAAIVLVAAPFALAQRMHGRAHGGPGGDFGGVMFLGHLQQAKHALNLSDQQVTDIENIFKDLRTQNQTYRDSLHGAMADIATTLINNPNDVAAAQALLDKQEATEHQMKVNALQAASKALNVLTADQRAKLGDFVKEHAAGRMMR